ncbi:hypothetical protein HELRODRAFT_165816 [Helobdella robusta]|uniref:C-type lectin domain-containing protein n=1 Tax=Helobdella robusta TaxID=6412 RepID=T1EXB5_HELRO|nr:hypothetical protein HELRODRAFT_165816 [Helobdella robusta]ESN91748.1 hypothetical protein HELRODRAFT_165816 [Helobdella robusta]
MIFNLIFLLLSSFVVLTHEEDKKYFYFVRAYSYLVVRNEKTMVSFEESGSFNSILRVSATSAKICMLKCQLLTGFKLRGVNFRPASKSCSCVETNSIQWYNVTALLNEECQAFFPVKTGTFECPPTFHYVVEAHKCFKMLYDLNKWSVAKSACNGLFSSHPLIIRNDLDFDISGKYAISVTKNHSYVCPGDFWGNRFVFWTGGYQKFINATRHFFWHPYSGNVPDDELNVTKWCPGQPDSYNGVDFCIKYVDDVAGNYVCWDDDYCSFRLFQNIRRAISRLSTVVFRLLSWSLTFLNIFDRRRHDSKFLDNSTKLMITSLTQKKWSNYSNDYRTPMEIGVL